MRKINYIVVHCSATREGCTLTSEALEAEHRRRGFRTTGYHYYIRRDGTVLGTRSLELPGAHCRGHNKYSIGICYEGGLDAWGNPKDTRTPEQRSAPAPAGVPAATTVPECPCMRPPRPQSRFGRRWDGGAVGVGEAVSVLRGK